MFDNNPTQCLLFPGIFAKPAVLQFDQRQGSSDGGVLLLKAADRRYGLIGCLAGCLRDERQAGQVDHSLKELPAQRVFSIACGYPDANDAARLAADPIHKMLLDRDPGGGRDLASQPTLSRFENAIGGKELYRLSEALAASVMQRHAERLRGRVRRVTLDLDPTDDATHGAQQLLFFNRHCDTWCYLPVMGFVSFNDEGEQYLCAAVLRPGNVTAAAGAVGILRRLMQLIRHFLPGVCIRVRLDGGFAQPQLLAVLDGEPDVEYVVAMAKNAVLKRKAKSAMRQACKLSRRSGKTEHVYREANYAARTWPHERRILIKAEVVRADGKEPKDNPRFVIANMKQSPQWIYEKVYCQRGEIEKPRKSMVRLSRELNSKVMNSDLRKSFTTAVKVSGELAPIVTASKKIEDWCLHQRPTEFQNLSSDEVMFIAHVYNWGLSRAKQIAAKFRYTIRQPLPVLLAALCVLDRNCNAQNAKRKPLSGSQFLRESVRQSCKAAHLHPHG